MIFRYPGGKSRMLPLLRKVLDPLLDGAEVYTEPFVGGGSVLLDVAARRRGMYLVVNDLDLWVACFWKTLVDTDSVFAEFIDYVDCTPTLAQFNILRARQPKSKAEAAFYALFFNRTTFSGMLDAGPIGGQEQKSKWTVGCRYNAKRLISELRTARELLSGRLDVRHGDALSAFPCADVPLYLDPPYYKQGPILYRHSMQPEQHAELARALSTRQNWVLSYDARPEVRNLYREYRVCEVGTRYSMSGEARASWTPGKEVIFCGRYRHDAPKEAA